MSAPIEIFVPSILGGIYKAFRTGTLTLQSGPITKTVYFDAGNIVFASSNLPEERLDERLLRRDLLNQDMLGRAVDSVQQLRIGQVLVDPSYLNEESLK